MTFRPKVKCDCGRVLLVGQGVQFTAINKVKIILDQAHGDVGIECRCGKRKTVSLDS